MSISKTMVKVDIRWIYILSMKVNIRWIYVNSKIAMEVDIGLIYVNFQNCNQSGYKLNIDWKYTNG